MSLSDLLGTDYDFDDDESLLDALYSSALGEDAELVAKVVQMVRLAKLLGSRVLRTHVSEEARHAATLSRAQASAARRLSGAQFLADSCPDGYVGWDPVEAVGADHVSPDPDEYGSAFINKKGQQCFAVEGVRKARAHNLLADLKKAKGRKVTPEDKRQLKVTVQMVRDFVRVGAELAKRLNDIGNADISCAQVNTFYGNEPADVKNRREFCGTLLTSDKKKKCQIVDDKCADA
jgi:hypothetical protein